MALRVGGASLCGCGAALLRNQHVALWLSAAIVACLCGGALLTSWGNE